MSIFEVLGYGSIVWSDKDTQLLVTYNGLHTFNIFASGLFSYTCTDMWTSAEPIEKLEDVEQYVDKHMNEVMW